MKFGLENTDEIELLVKERDALKEKNEKLHDVLDEFKAWGKLAGITK